MVQQIGQDELVSAFSQSVGVEKATEIVESAAATAGIESKPEYTTQEIVRLCDTIQSEYDSGFINIVANEFKIQKQADKRFYALFGNIPDPAVVLEFDGPEAVVRAVNEGFTETFGYQEKNIVGEPLTAVIVPDDGIAETRTTNTRLLSGETVEREVQRKTADGELRDFLFRATAIEKETGAMEAYSIYTDVTERNRRQRKLEQRNEMLEEFSTVVTHDLRNPLSIAESHLTFALEDIDDTVDGYEFLSDVAEAIDRMDNLIEDLLALARHGQRIQETESVDLTAIAHNAWKQVKTGEATLDVADLPTIEADEGRLLQILENLYRNSIEHGASQIDDDFEVRVGPLSELNGFYVEDTGSGIEDDMKEKVLEYGFTTEHGGTGLGLSIVTSIAEAHNWRVRVCDGIDGGARFEIHGVELVDE